MGRFCARPWEVAYDPAGRLLNEYRLYCEELGIPFERHLSLEPPDPSTLFCVAGMQRHKPSFRDPSVRGTIGDVQRCVRLEDLDTVGDGTHWLSFDMLGMFSFRERSVEEVVGLWWTWLDRVGIRPDHVTLHPDRPGWERFHQQHGGPHGVEVRVDPSCTWTDGEQVGYCTEFFVGDVEIGNIVNPLGDCIDVGFGLDRLGLVSGDPPPRLEDVLRETAVRLLDDGYLPSNKRQGYVLRRLLRRMVREHVVLDHPVYREEEDRQRRLGDRYRRLLPHHPDQSAEWWWRTHGIDPSAVEE